MKQNSKLILSELLCKLRYVVVKDYTFSDYVHCARSDGNVSHRLKLALERIERLDC